jgi:hypothetical protein
VAGVTKLVDFKALIGDHEEVEKLGNEVIAFAEKFPIPA